MINILLCGGSGTRLWPLSRKLFPKQFTKIFNKQSLFQISFSRNAEVSSKIIVVAGEDHYFIADDQLKEIKSKKEHRYVLEPIGRNTAPAIALAIKELDDEEIILVTPSDHLIEDENAFQECCKQAKKLAKKDHIVTFGIAPSHPETGFGYIKFIGDDVIEFVEKPNLQTAQRYLESKQYLWNSGMFCFKVRVFKEELKKLRSDIFEACEKIEFIKDKNLSRINREDMAKIPSESIDYAVMEKSKNVKVVQSDFSWSDVGSFDAIYQKLEKDENYNTKHSKHLSFNSKNNLVLTHKKVIATVDVEDLIIVDTDDALMITKKGSSQKIKDVVEEIKKIDPDLCDMHKTVHRPWGRYTVLKESEGYKLKTIKVNPNSKLSLQRHQHRNEHWVVVKGKAKITKEGESFTLYHNESTYIPAGTAHRLENPTDEDLIIVEAQVGSYVGEDDIERLDDDYKRS